MNHFIFIIIIIQKIDNLALARTQRTMEHVIGSIYSLEKTADVASTLLYIFLITLTEYPPTMLIPTVEVV